MRKKLVAFIGAIGAGKSTAASEFTNWTKQYQRIGFADPLKSMLMALGLTPVELYGNDKEKPSVLLSGKTPRYAMQKLGEEWGRQLISSEIWVNAWLHRVSCNTIGTVVDDLRYPNEYSAVRSLGGIIVKVVRHGCTTNSGHQSEMHFDNFNYDYILTNDNTPRYWERIRKLRKEIAEYSPEE